MNMYKYNFLLLLLSFFGYKPFSQAQETPVIKQSYPLTIMPSDTTKLWVTAGNPAQEKVLILLQGGPKGSLNFVKNGGRSSWRYIPNYENYYRIHLHQSTTYNPKMFEYTDDFTLENAKTEVDNSSEMLYRAINYFKNKGKTVYVLGHSYGAFIIPHYLATRPSLADKYIVISGRIDDDLVALEAHRQGFNGDYLDDGLRMVPHVAEDLDIFDADEKKYYYVKQLLKWGSGLPRYSEELAEVDLSNVIYIHHPKDSRVGRLTEEELAFLASKNVKVFSTNYEHGWSIAELVFLMRTGVIKF